MSDERLLERWNACGYYRLVGMRVERADAQGSEFSITIGGQHLQAYGTAHGGVLAGLVDAAMGLAILGGVPDGEGCATIEMKLNFLAPASPGGFCARGRVVQQGKRIVVAWGEVDDAKGRAVACGIGTFQRIPLER